jgi:tetratricopeptide (TPR) repeat protein
MKYRCLLYIFFMLPVLAGITSCKKYLDAKPDDRLSLPATIADMQLLMDDYNSMNARFAYAQELAADNFYLATEDWQTQIPVQRDLYTWQPNDQTLDQWTSAYESVLSANVVLDNIDGVNYSPAEQSSWRNVKGSALFFRAAYFYNLAQVFAVPYNESSAGTDLGIPLRLNADYTQVSVRASIAQTYQQIISDLQQAAALLPETPMIKSRPCKPAAFGLLGRIYLDMQEYEKAGLYADSCLQLYDRLIDFNTLDAAADIPMERFNDEVIFEALSPLADGLSQAVCKIDTILYGSYAPNDLRRGTWFFNNMGYISFKGDYGARGPDNGQVFTGVVTDEQYLIRAESHARAGNSNAAMNDLNTLLEKRWLAGSFVPLTATDANDALRKVLTERRKELLFRGTRWSDLRRFRNDPQFAVTPVRILNGQRFELPPNSPRYVLKLPASVIEMTNMPQNP